MNECQIGCITSDDEGRGYYCEECPELGKAGDPTLIGPDGFTRLAPIGTDDKCEHGADYDAECPPCETEIAQAKAAGALTPHEIGLYWKGAEAARTQVAEAELHIQQLTEARGRAEARIERAERLIDSWEHDAPDHSNPVFIGRLREVLRRDPAPVRLRDESTEERCVVCSRSAPRHGGLCCFHKYDEQPMCNRCAADEDLA